MRLDGMEKRVKVRKKRDRKATREKHVTGRLCAVLTEQPGNGGQDGGDRT